MSHQKSSPHRRNPVAELKVDENGYPEDHPFSKVFRGSIVAEWERDNARRLRFKEISEQQKELEETLSVQKKWK